MNWTILYLLFFLTIGLTFYAQITVQKNFSKYSNERNSRNLTGGQVARIILDRNGLNDVRIERVGGNLTDHYSPNEKVLRLSENVIDRDSISAIRVASHEVGHALQDRDYYQPMKIRQILVPLANIGSRMAIYLLILATLVRLSGLYDIAIIMYSLAVSFYVITLPVEINASRRALIQLDNNSLISNDEYRKAKKVLKAAALTYIASAMASLYTLLSLLARRDRRR